MYDYSNEGDDDKEVEAENFADLNNQVININNDIPQRKYIICPNCGNTPILSLIYEKYNPFSVSIECKDCLYNKILPLCTYINIIESYSITDPSLFYICSTKNHKDKPAISFCRTCQKFLCCECYEEHLKIIEETYDYHEYYGINKNKKYNFYCKKHKKNNYISFCVDCNEHLCKDCDILKHLDNEHNVLNLELISDNLSNDDFLINKITEIFKELFFGTEINPNINKSLTKLKHFDEYKYIVDDILLLKNNLIKLIYYIKNSYIQEYPNYYYICNYNNAFDVYYDIYLFILSYFKEKCHYGNIEGLDKDIFVKIDDEGKEINNMNYETIKNFKNIYNEGNIKIYNNLFVYSSKSKDISIYKLTRNKYDDMMEYYREMEEQHPQVNQDEEEKEDYEPNNNISEVPEHKAEENNNRENLNEQLMENQDENIPNDKIIDDLNINISESVMLNPVKNNNISNNSDEIDTNPPEKFGSNQSSKSEVLSPINLGKLSDNFSNNEDLKTNINTKENRYKAPIKYRFKDRIVVSSIVFENNKRVFICCEKLVMLINTQTFSKENEYYIKLINPNNNLTDIGIINFLADDHKKKLGLTDNCYNLYIYEIEVTNLQTRLNPLTTIDNIHENVKLDNMSYQMHSSIKGIRRIIGISKDRYITATFNEFKVWDCNTYKLLKGFKEKGLCTICQLSCALIITGHIDRVIIWNIDSIMFKQKKVFKDIFCRNGKNIIREITYNKFAVSSMDNKIYVINAETLSKVKSIETNSFGVGLCIGYFDKSYVMVGSEKGIIYKMSKKDCRLYEKENVDIDEDDNILDIIQLEGDDYISIHESGCIIIIYR